MENLNRNKGNLYILFTAFLWSLGGLLIKYIPGHAIAINGARSIIAFMFFVCYRRSFKIKISKLILLAAMCLCLTNNLYCFANKLTTAANAIVLQYLAPIYVLIWNSLYYKTKPQKKQITFIGLAMAGMILFFFDQLGGGAFLGNILAILSGITFSGVYFINSLPEASSDDASMLGFFISFLISIPFLNQFPYTNPVSVGALLILGIFQVGLAYVVFAKGAKLTTPVNASLIGLSEALMNPLWVFLFYGEKVGNFALIGGAIIILAVILNIKNTE